MKVALRLGITSFFAFSATAHCDEQGLTSEKLKVYVETLRTLKEPVSSSDIVARFLPILGKDVAAKEGTISEPNPERQHNVDLHDRHINIGLTFLPHKSGGLTAKPIYNLIRDQRFERGLCERDPIGFENFRIRDIKNLYGQWTGFLDSNMTKANDPDTFYFKSGDLTIIAEGCKELDPNDTRVYSIHVEWPHPEWDKYYK